MDNEEYTEDSQMHSSVVSQFKESLFSESAEVAKAFCNSKMKEYGGCFKHTIKKFSDRSGNGGLISEELYSQEIFSNEVLLKKYDAEIYTAKEKMQGYALEMKKLEIEDRKRTEFEMKKIAEMISSRGTLKFENMEKESEIEGTGKKMNSNKHKSFANLANIIIEGNNSKKFNQFPPSKIKKK